MKRWDSAHLSELETVGGPGTLRWAPVRRPFGIAAFGINAFVASDAGQDVVERHTEQARGHEEAYLVVAGTATFTLDGEELDAPAGTILFVRDPAVERHAIANEPGTTVLAVGAKAGVAYGPGPWEPIHLARALGEAGDVEGALAELGTGLELHPAHRMILYRLAGWEASAGRRDAASTSSRKPWRRATSCTHRRSRTPRSCLSATTRASPPSRSPRSCRVAGSGYSPIALSTTRLRRRPSNSA